MAVDRAGGAGAATDRAGSLRAGRRLLPASAHDDVESGPQPIRAELADRMHLPPERIRQSLQSKAAYRATSLATPVGSSGTLGDLRGAEDPGYDTVDTHDALGCALARLPERDRRMLQLRFYGNMPQARIAVRVGASQMHVSRLLSRTLSRLLSRTLSRLREDLVGAG